MRNIRKSSTLESKFPLLAVEQGCIISKDGDITVAYEVTLPEIFTVTSQEYESVHAAWCKAIKVLPDYSIVHKQDWFVKENYAPDLQNSDMSFLSRSYERHFNERPYLHHQCYLFLTKTSKERMDNKYGEHGLMKLLASKSHPRYILNRRKTNRMFKHKKKEE